MSRYEMQIPPIPEAHEVEIDRAVCEHGVMLSERTWGTLDCPRNHYARIIYIPVEPRVFESGVVTMTLTEFLTARFDEAEAVARAVKPLGETVDMGGERHPETFGVERYGVEGVEGRIVSSWDAEATALLRHLPPARVLAEVEAKRRIVAEHRTDVVVSLDPSTRYQEFDACVRCQVGERQVVAPCTTIRLLALPYADHPSYDEAWRP